jgi:hypothetical protein
VSMPLPFSTFSMSWLSSLRLAQRFKSRNC